LNTEIVERLTVVSLAPRVLGKETPNMIKVVVVKPGELPEIRDIGEDLASFKEIVGGYLELVPNRGQDNFDILINEEGQLLGLPFNRRVRGFEVLGPVLVTASDDAGEPRSLTSEEIAQAMNLLRTGA
jgi:hypothetical protein